MATAGSGVTPPSRRRRILVWVLIAAATVLAFASALTVWVRRQALDTNAVTKASTQMLQNDQVRGALSIYLVDQLYNNVNVTQALSARLPKQLQPLAAPLAGGLRQLSVQTANQLLQRPRVQQLFANAVHTAHTAFLRIINGNAKSLASSGGIVYLDLKPVLTELAAQIGIGSRLVARLPATAGRIEIMKQSQLDAIQNSAKVIKALTIFLAIVVFGLYALAIYLARGFRRRTLRSVGVAFVIVGVLLLVVRRIAGNMVVDSLSSGDIQQPARNVWLIATSLLSDIAWAFLGYGLLLAFATILAGPTRPAFWVRRHLAPALREHVGLVYTVVGLLYLLLVLWAPTRLQTTWYWVLAFAALIAVGVEVFRRQTINEFPAETNQAPTATPN